MALPDKESSEAPRKRQKAEETSRASFGCNADLVSSWIAPLVLPPFRHNTPRRRVAAAAAAKQGESTSSESSCSSLVQDSIQCATEKLLHVKESMGSVSSSRSFAQARRHCNPYEALDEEHWFLNRSALKLANMDACLHFSLTETSFESSSSEERLSSLVFCDLCGAPGGFSEYLTWRRQRAIVNTTNAATVKTRGYGMSLRGTNVQGQGLRWKLSNWDDDYTRYRIDNGKDGSGDLYHWGNVEHLQKRIDVDSIRNEANKRVKDGEQTEEAGAHLVVCDGGFDAQRNANNQEELAQKLVVSEAAAAVTLLRRGGKLVLKMFGFQTKPIRALMKYLYAVAFDTIVVLKPISSRPASAERYLVCTGFCGKPDGWDGPSFVDQVLGNSLSSRFLPNMRVDEEEALFSSMDSFDRDMIELNLKACSQILHHLSPSQPASEAKDDSTTQTVQIDVAKYKKAWRLD